MTTLLLFLSLINFWLDIKSFEENDYLKVNYSKHFSIASFSFSEAFCYSSLKKTSEMGAFLKNYHLIKDENPLPPKDSHLKHGYLMFLLGLALTAIGIEFLLNRKANGIKRANDSLVVHHQVMLKKNSTLHTKLSTLQQNTETKNRLFQVMAHDLRSPLAAIVGLSSFMIDEKKLPPEDLEVIDLIHTSGQDSLKFINDILHEEENTENRKKRINLKQLISYCIAQLEVSAADKQQRFVFQGSDVYLNLDREKIWRVMINLLSNAVKFSRPLSTITVSISLRAHQVRIAVADEGIGIPDHIKQYVFTNNESRKRAGTRGEQSFGFGLAISKQHVEAHGGKLTFESVSGSGTTFYVDLPKD